MSTKKKVSVWTIDKSRYTDEELRKIKLRAESTDRADEFFKDLYGQRVAWVIVTNIMEQGSRAFEQITDIIFRAVNHLPFAGKDTGQMAEFKAKRKGVSA